MGILHPSDTICASPLDTKRAGHHAAGHNYLESHLPHGLWFPNDLWVCMGREAASCTLFFQRHDRYLSFFHMASAFSVDTVWLSWRLTWTRGSDRASTGGCLLDMGGWDGDMSNTFSRRPFRRCCILFLDIFAQRFRYSLGSF
jgi:hypothetical protein